VIEFSEDGVYRSRVQLLFKQPLDMDDGAIGKWWVENGVLSTEVQRAAQTSWRAAFATLFARTTGAWAVERKTIDSITTDEIRFPNDLKYKRVK
jgi:hypothetical protein